MKYNYKCKENDVLIQFHSKEYEIDELWVQVEGEKSWTVIGYKDLILALEKAKKKFKPKTSHDYGGGYIGEALFNLENLK